MIINKEPLSMAEALEYTNSENETETEVIGFIKKFMKTKKGVKELKRKLQELGLLKVKAEHIAKIIDLMPETAEELNKIFVDVSLDEDEVQKIANIVKEFK